MIYKVYLIDGDNGISLLEATLKSIKEDIIDDKVITDFFKVTNQTIDDIQNAMSKGKKVEEIMRVIESEESIIVLYYHPLSRVLFCSISDADDDVVKIKNIISKIGNRFWKKHQSDLENYRTTTEKSLFLSFVADIENLTVGGRVAEVFPKLLIVKSVLEKILTMGLIDEFEFKVALQCNGKNSPLKISRRYKDKSRLDIEKTLNKLVQLDIVKV
ncbi:MAG: hypothetical protein GF353_28785 [Candidatus Lokiarchaeota archaeon]|nr:hypothetical protein [Candidatus Lokiarchaeota archaeon]